MYPSPVMELPHHPIVSPLPPSPSIPKDHHGPWRRRRVSLPDDGPSYFRNPWKSYRTASLTDAWLAYQKGAAIAPHQPRSAAPSRPSSRASTSQAPDLEDESEDDDEDEPLVGAGTSTKSKGYVRPEFSTWHEEDHEDDWRDPPLEVVPPRWDEVGEDRPNVTWLGHAGVLVQIPWKRKAGGREGMCGVLFDPIFSYRSARPREGSADYYCQVLAFAVHRSRTIPRTALYGSRPPRHPRLLHLARPLSVP